MRPDFHLGIRGSGEFDEADSLSRSDYLRASPPLLDPEPVDRFTRVHWSVPLLVFLPVVLILARTGYFRDGTFNTLGLMVFGYLLWSLTEYWMHRTVFHFEPERGIGAKLHHLIHGVHHDHPNDPKRLVMPPSASVPLAIVFCLAFSLVFGGSWCAVAAGFIGGYLIYDMTHYALHHHVPKTRIARYLRELHMRHHFEDDERGYGVSAPYWDHVFGTAPKRTRE
jgi:sterol desaturase/sphingolipid hydroxylase (fatty acid hydroxylase superfamily)